MKKHKNRLQGWLLTALAATVLLVGCSQPSSHPAKHRGIYHWKTVYNPSDWEKGWMRQHKVDRLYVKLFDVEAGYLVGHLDWKMVPAATTLFRQPLPEEMDVVPVVCITVDAILALDGDYYDISLYAKLLVKRIGEMMRENHVGTFHEVQMDCDWMEQTEDT